MAAVFQSLGRTVIAGIVLLLIIIVVAGAGTGQAISLDMNWSRFFMRWLHVLSGVMWIGLLWYFNFVQIPSMPKIPDEQKPAIGMVQVSPEEKTAAARKAMLTSRLNTMLSIPMLYCMVAQQNGGL